MYTRIVFLKNDSLTGQHFLPRFLKDQRRLRFQRGKIFLLVDQRTIEEVDVDLGWVVCHLDRKGTRDYYDSQIHRTTFPSSFPSILQLRSKKKINAPKIPSIKKIRRYTLSYLYKCYFYFTNRDRNLAPVMQRRIVQNLIVASREGKGESGGNGRKEVFTR